jgi:putative peptidoglycan binding protein
VSSDHVVQQGECLSRIACRYGLKDAKSLHDHPDNAELKKKRPNPNVLRPGDVVRVPQARVKRVDAATEQTHRFRLTAPQKELRVKLLDASGAPLKGEPYEFEIGDRSVEGRTDGEGTVTTRVADHEHEGRLKVADRLLVLRFGHLNPVQPDDGDWSGVRARLENLGYDVGEDDASWRRRRRSALALFQHDHDLEIDGEPSQETLAKLEEAHGS